MIEHTTKHIYIYTLGEIEDDYNDIIDKIENLVDKKNNGLLSEIQGHMRGEVLISFDHPINNLNPFN